MELIDLKRIEKALNIRLPTHFVSFNKNFQEDIIIIDPFIYSDVDQLIQMNQILGFYSEEQIVKKKLAIGENGGGDFYLIDLENTSDERVYFFDHEESTENHYNEETKSWNWNAFEFSDNLENHLNEIKEILTS